MIICEICGVTSFGFDLRGLWYVLLDTHDVLGNMH
jgi:hypothetical protein